MISMIAALSNHGVIGKAGVVPFDLRADRRHFMLATQGHVVVMGRKTFDSIGKPLPNRLNVVLSKDVSWRANGVFIQRNFEDCLAYVLSLATLDEVMVIGGEQIYRLFLPHANKLILTHVNAKITGDTYFPQFDAAKWNAKVIMHHEADSQNQYPFVVRKYTRK